ncbi:MAG TPA: hypothetical protein PLN86_12295 [Candidatus Hydrogenedentes bacterium]|nr:hypothetical protein [Candidatus Hydrogenedentota bacterium]
MASQTCLYTTDSGCLTVGGVIKLEIVESSDADGDRFRSVNFQKTVCYFGLWCFVGSIFVGGTARLYTARAYQVRHQGKPVLARHMGTRSEDRASSNHPRGLPRRAIGTPRNDSSMQLNAAQCTDEGIRRYPKRIVNN